jgi:hypothetical protein
MTLRKLPTNNYTNHDVKHDFVPDIQTDLRARYFFSLMRIKLINNFVGSVENGACYKSI